MGFTMVDYYYYYHTITFTTTNFDYYYFDYFGTLLTIHSVYKKLLKTFNF